MIIKSTFQPVYSITKNGKRGRIIDYTIVSEERIYSPNELDESGNIRPKTETEKRIEAEKFFMALTGMSIDDFARKILIDYNKEIHNIE